MNINKRLPILIPLIAIAVVMFAGYEGFGWKNDFKEVAKFINNTNNLLSVNASSITQTEESKVIDKAWQILEEYKVATHNHDFDTVKRLSSKLSDTCLDETKREECYVLMDSVYAILISLDKSQFNHALWNESKITLYTDIMDGVKLALFFTKDISGEPKIAGMRVCLIDGTTPDECSTL